MNIGEIGYIEKGMTDRRVGKTVSEKW